MLSISRNLSVLLKVKPIRGTQAQEEAVVVVFASSRKINLACMYDSLYKYLYLI